MRNQGGFTLFEMTVALAMTSILMAVAVPIYGNVVDAVRVEMSARQLVADLREVQSLAVRDNGTWSVVFETGTGSYVMSAPDGSAVSRGLPPDMVIASASFSGGEVHFSPDGSPSSPGHILIRGRHQVRMVWVTAVSGRVTVEIP